MNKKINQAGLDLIKKFEGLRLKAYQDSVGVWTVGYGHTKDVKEGQEITPEQAEQFLKEDVVTAENAVNKYVTVAIGDNQFDALVSFTFNLGSGNLKASTLLKKLNASDIKGAAEEFLRWNKAGGKVLEGLSKRRQAEKDLFLT